MLNAIKKYFMEFKILGQTPKEFWMLNLVINFFEMLAYFAFITVLSLYLTNNLGLSDALTGDIMGYFTLGITIIIFVAGPIIDWIGIKKALIISMILLIPTRFFMGFTDYIERQALDKSLDQTQAVTAIQKGSYQDKIFTMNQERMINAQVDIALGHDKKLDAKDLRKDSKKLLETVVVALEKSPVIAKKWKTQLSKPGSDWHKSLTEAVKDSKTYKSLLVDYVVSMPSLATKHTYQLDKLPAEDLQNALLDIIIATPELREQFTIVDFIRILVYLMLVLIAIGEALMVPAIYVSIRRFTNKNTSGAGFNFQYLTMNVGAVLSYMVFDGLRGHFGNLAGNEAIFITGGICALICTVAALKLRTAIEVKEDGEVVKYKSEKEMRSTDEKKENIFEIIFDVLSESAFWRFMFFIIILIGVRLVFTHQFMVMPKYYMRVLGPDAQIGLLNMINPAIIVAGLILFIPLISRFSVFRLIVVGTFISAVSVFFLMIPGKAFTVLGWSIEQGYFALILAQVIVFAIGEIIWSPRLSEYTVVIAPKGREGTYMSLAVLPMFIAKPLNGMISGRLLDSYCPEGVLNEIASGARNFWNGPEFMWLIFSVIAISSPIGVILFKRVIQGKKEEI